MALGLPNASSGTAATISLGFAPISWRRALASFPRNEALHPRIDRIWNDKDGLREAAEGRRSEVEIATLV
jgi:hypothetical protein